MRCDEVRAALLDAEPSALRGSADSALARHIRDCAACSADAARVLGQIDTLRAAMDTVVAARTAAAPRRRARVRLLAPLLLAAMLTLVLLDGGRIGLSLERHAPVGLYIPETRAPSETVVNATGASGVAVIRTANPDITVVWNFGEAEP